MRIACLILAACALVGLLSLPVAAQGLTCADFSRNPNGSWSPVRVIHLNGITMGPGVAFSPGVYFGGVDLATILNQQCR
jgi:hypothetical protein